MPQNTKSGKIILLININSTYRQWKLNLHKKPVTAIQFSQKNAVTIFFLARHNSSESS